MSKTHRTLAGRTIENLRRLWTRKNRRRPEFDTLRRPRLEFLEGRAMMHAGHDHGEGEDPSYDPNTSFHVHYDLAILVNGDQVVIPKGVGNNLGANSGKIHTHDFSGKIHVHPGARSTFVTVGEFFDTWRNDTALGNANALFSSTNVMGNLANGTHTVRMYVNGTLNTDFENYEFHDNDKIVISYEPLAATNRPTFDPLANQTLLAGAPLWLPLDGIDPNGGPLTYTVSVENSSLVQATIPTGNRTLKMDVTDFGVMQFQLFDHLVPDVTNRMAQLINAGFYNKTATNEIRFHRVSPNFVIQAGDPTNTGSGGSTLGDFDDQFHLDLQHTSSGLLSMAKAGDDTNDSQFFVTDRDTRHLDFNHSVWGRLIDGEEIRDAINSVPLQLTNPSLPFNATTNPFTEKPVTPVVINSMSLVTDTENGALMLKAAEGATGTTNVTVTVTDAQGNTFSQTFAVTVAADTANSAPFLVNPPANVSGAAGQVIQFQLQASDAENNPNFFEVIGTGASANYTRSPASGADANGNVTYTPVASFTSSPFSSLVTNSVTGQVSVTPKAGFTGTFTLRAAVRGTTTTTTSDTFDVQDINVTVGPLAPTSIDLLAASDSGNNSDNVTNVAGTNAPTGSMQFTVSGVTNGALVKLMKGTSVLASGTASGTSITFTTTSLGALGDGVHVLTATQTVGGIESGPSAVLNVTLDTTSPGPFTSTAPTEADVGIDLAYDAQNPLEGATGFQYQLVTPPAGMTINAATGVVTWVPLASQIGAQTFGISAVDAAGNVTTQTVSLTVDQPIPPKVVFSLTLTKPDGSLLTALGANQDFVLNFFASDVRAVPHGVFAAFADITWDGTKATVTGPLVYTSDYGGIQSGNTATPGLIDEGGAISGLTELGGGPKKVFSVPMRSSASGALVFSTNFADLSPNHNILLNQNNGIAILEEEITFGTVSITVNPTFNAVADTFNVNEDAAPTTLNPLANDTNVGTATNVLTISAVGARDHGGTVTIATDGKTILYTPAANFFGTETFTYTARNQNNEEAIGTITVQVQPQNDTPTAVANSFNVEKNSSNTLLDVLANDTFTPDTGETLRVTAVGTGSQGGTITIVNNGSGIRYTPKANFTGQETFTYTISDRATSGLTSQATVTVNVSTALPSAATDAATIAEDATTPIEINVLANDSLGEGTALTITAVGAGNRGGTITITQNGTRITYLPAANAQGIETFTYTINNGLGTATGTVNVTITNSNDPPTATGDTLTAFKDIANTLDVLANDTSAPDPAENLIIDTVTQGAHGTVAITEGGKKISYTPTAGYTGADSFTYTIRDPGGLTSTSATVNVTVQQFVPSSLAGFVYFDVDNDGQKDSSESPIGNVTITLTGTDVNSAAVNRTVKTGPDGSYKFDNLLPGNYTITQPTQPALTIDGKDTAGSQGGSTATNDKIFITNLAQNTTGINNNFGERGRQAAMTIQGEVVPLITIRDFFSSNSRNYAIAAFDSSGNALWNTTHGSGWQGYSTNSIVLQNSQLKLQLTNGASQQFTTSLPLSDDRVTLIGNPNGNSLYRLRGAPGNLNLSPIVVNQAPTASGNQFTTNEDTVLNVAVASSILANDTDPEGTTLTASVVTQPAHGTLTLNANGSFTYTPAANYNGSDSFTYRASDGTTLSAPATVNITVTAVNDAPVAQNNTFTANKDAALTVAVANGVLVNDSDPDGASVALTAIIVTQPAHGSVTLNTNGSFTYTPTAGYSGPDSFTYKANDGTLDSTPATVNITVNNAPVAVADTYTTNEDTALTVNAATGVLLNDTDAETNPLTAVIVTQPAHGTVTLNANGSFTYTPTANYSGPDSFTYKANDGHIDSAAATVNLTVTAVNDAPVAVADSYTATEDTALTVELATGVLDNDTDPEDNPLTASIVTQPAHGTVTLNTDGSFTYTPTANYNGPDTFTYKANDGSLDSAAIAVSITVTAVNDSPVAAADSFITNEDTALTVALANGVLVNDTDADGTSVALTAIAVTQPAHGTLTLNANGTLTYTPTANYNGPDSFTYKANDGTADSAVATVNITVTAVNDAPVAVNDNYSVEPGESLTITAPGILSNDTDVENTTLTPTVVTQPLHGTVTVNADGSFTYTPETGSTATTDGFSYTVSDGTATSTVAAVTITIEAAGEGEAADAAMLALLADEGDEESMSTEDADWQSAIDEALAELTA